MNLSAETSLSSFPSVEILRFQALVKTASFPFVRMLCLEVLIASRR